MRNTLIFICALLFVCIQNVSAQKLDLDAYLALVEDNNKDIKLAAKEVDYAKAQRREAVSSALPKVFAEAGYTRNLSDYYMFADFSSFMEDGGGISKFKVNFNNEYSFNTSLVQPLYNFQIGSALKASKQYRQLIDYGFDAQRQHIRTYAKKAFYQVLLLKKIVAVNEASLQNAYENYENMQNRYENGLASQLELLQAEVRWKNAVPVVDQAKRNYKLAVNNLKMMAGIPFGDRIELEGALDTYPSLPHERELDSILAQRPDFNALLWEKKLRKTNYEAERGAYYPTVQGFFTYAFSSLDNEWHLGQRNNLYVAGLSLSVPIYTGGYIGSQVQKARIEVDKTSITIDKTKEAIYTEFSNVELRLKEAFERINSAEALMETAEKAFSIAETTAASGLTTQLDLKDTRLAYDQAQLNYVKAIYDYHEAYFDWELTIGSVR